MGCIFAPRSAGSCGVFRKMATSPDMYFRLNDKLEIIRQPYGATVWDGSKHDYLTTNRAGRCILEACDGTAQLDDLVSRFAVVFRSDVNTSTQATEDVRSFVVQALQDGVISQLPGPREGHVSIRGSNERLSVVRAEISVTDRCNMACTYCCAESGPAFPSQDLTTQQWLHIIDLLRTAGLRKATITGGEPFVRADIIELLEYLRDSRIAVSLLTNGMLIDESTAKFLSRLGNLTEVKISIDAVENANIHNRERGEGSCQRAMRTLSLLRDYGITTVVNMTVHRLNKNELQPIAEWCSKHGHQLEASPILLEGRASQEYYLSPSEEEFFWRALESTERNYPGTITPATDEYSPAWSPKFRCALMYGAVGMSAQGKLLPCLRADSFFGSLGLGIERADDLVSLGKFTIEETEIYGVVKDISSCFVPNTKVCSPCEYLMRWCNGCVVAQHAMRLKGFCPKEDMRDESDQGEGEEGCLA